MYGFRCQALVSLGPLSTPIKDLANGFPAQAVLRPKGGIRVASARSIRMMLTFLTLAHARGLAPVGYESEAKLEPARKTVEGVEAQ
jgi:hypothetical protein